MPRIYLLNKWIREYSLCLQWCLALGRCFIKVCEMNWCLPIVSLEKLARCWSSGGKIPGSPWKLLCLSSSCLQRSPGQPPPVPAFLMLAASLTLFDVINRTELSGPERCCLIDSKAGNSDPSTETFPGDQITGCFRHSSICSLATRPLTLGLTT